MAKISSYPSATPESGDFVIGTDANDMNKTVQFHISSLTGLNTLQSVLEAGDSSTVSFTIASGALDPSSIDHLHHPPEHSPPPLTIPAQPLMPLTTPKCLLKMIYDLQAYRLLNPFSHSALVRGFHKI